MTGNLLVIEFISISSTAVVSSEEYMQWSEQGTVDSTSILNHLLVTTSCRNSEVLAVTCQPVTCGMPSDLTQELIINGQDASPGEYIFVIIAYTTKLAVIVFIIISPDVV